jgi:hypothetical protein
MPATERVLVPSRPAVGRSGVENPRFGEVHVVRVKSKKESWEPPGPCALPAKLNCTFQPPAGNAGPPKRVVVVDPGSRWWSSCA